MPVLVLSYAISLYTRRHSVDTCHLIVNMRNDMILLVSSLSSSPYYSFLLPPIPFNIPQPKGGIWSDAVTLSSNRNLPHSIDSNLVAMLPFRVVVSMHTKFLVVDAY